MKELLEDIINNSPIENMEKTKKLVRQCDEVYERLDEYKTNPTIYRNAIEYINKRLRKLITVLDEQTIEKYLTPQKIDEYKFRSYVGRDMLLMLSPEKIDEYLTPENYEAFGFISEELIAFLRRMGEEISKKYFFGSQNFNNLKSGLYYNSSVLNISNVIKSMGNEKIKEYLTLENIRKFKLNAKGITSLINTLGKDEKSIYKFQNQERDSFSVANIIKAEQPNNIEDYLTVKAVEIYKLNDSDINNLIQALGESERKKYVIPGQEEEKYGILNIYYYHSKNSRKRQLIEIFYAENKNAFSNSYSMLDNDYIFEKFDDYMINYISCFEKESEILAKCSNICLDVIAKMLENFQTNNNTDEWMYLLDIILKQIHKIEKVITDIQVKNIEELDDKMIENFTKMLINSDISSGKISIDDLKNYEQNRMASLPIDYESFMQKINNIEDYMKGEGFWRDFLYIETQINLLLISKFGISYEQAKNILEEYGQDIDSIQNEDLKVFIKSIQALVEFDRKYNKNEEFGVAGKYYTSKYKCIISSDFARRVLQEYGDKAEDIDDPDLKEFVKAVISKDDNVIISDCLKNIADNVEPIPEESRLNILALEKRLKQEYMKLYLPTLLSLKDCKQTDENIYELPIDENGNVKKFNILLTSISAFRDTYERIDNYFDRWNKTDLTSLHFCASYIGREMLSLAPIPHVCFGFSQVTEDSLLLSSYQDIGSSGDKMASTSELIEHYCNPEHQIELVEKGGGKCKCRRNEMDIRRNVNGHRIQPDYIVAFRTNGRINNIAKIRQAQKDFKQKGIDLPIIIVDRDKCLEAEKHEIEEMKKEYNQNPSEELRRRINTKIKTNNYTLEYIRDAECEKIDFDIGSEISRPEEKHEGNIDKNILDAMRESAEMTTQEQRTQMMSRFVQLKNILRQENVYGKQR